MIDNDTYPQWVQVGGTGISSEQYNQWRASLGYKIDTVPELDLKSAFVLVAVKIENEEDRVAFRLRFGV